MMTHTLDKLQHFFWRHMTPHIRASGCRRVRHAVRDSRGVRTARRAHDHAAPAGTPVVLLSDHGPAPLHTYFAMNWLSDTARGPRRQPGAPRGPGAMGWMRAAPWALMPAFGWPRACKAW